MIVALELAPNVGGVFVIRISVAVSVLVPDGGDFVRDRVHNILMEGWEHEGNPSLPFAEPLAILKEGNPVFSRFSEAAHGVHNNMSGKAAQHFLASFALRLVFDHRSIGVR